MSSGSSDFAVMKCVSLIFPSPLTRPPFVTNGQREKQEGAWGAQRVVSCSNHSLACPSLFQLIYFAFMNLRD